MTVEKPNLKQLQQQENWMAWLKPKPLPGFEIATNTVAFANKFFPFATKISGEVPNLRKGYQLPNHWQENAAWRAAK